MIFFYLIIIIYSMLLSSQIYLINIDINKEKIYIYLIGLFSSICGIIITIIKIIFLKKKIK